MASSASPPLEKLGNFNGRAAQEFQFEPVEVPCQLHDVRDEQADVDGVRQSQAQGSNLTALERGRECCSAPSALS